jgi:hypothetical protein
MQDRIDVPLHIGRSLKDFEQIVAPALVGS